MIWLIAWIPLLACFSRKFQGFGGIWANLGKFGKFRENSVELSGIQWGFVWRLVWIQWEFLGDFGATPDFRENLGFGVVSGDLGGQKAFAQIATVIWQQEHLRRMAMTKQRRPQLFLRLHLTLPWRPWPRRQDAWASLPAWASQHHGTAENTLRAQRLKKKQSRLKFSISLEIFNLAGVRKESKKSPKLRFWTLFGLHGWTLFGLRGALFALRAQRLKKTNLDWNFQSRSKFSISLENFNPGPSEFPTKNRGLVGGALENFNLDWRFQSWRAILNFFNLWALREYPKIANPFPPYSIQKAPRTPNLSKICPDDCFSGFQSGGLKFVKKLSKNDNFRTNFQIFDKFLTNLGPPDWNPEKQSSGQILDKFGVPNRRFWML